MKKLCVLILFVISSCNTNTSKGDRCGDNIIDPGEECDGYDRGGAYCQMLGYYGGRLSCNDDCTLNINSCAANGSCGDGVVQMDFEECEGENLTGDTCVSVGYSG